MLGRRGALSVGAVELAPNKQVGLLFGGSAKIREAGTSVSCNPRKNVTKLIDKPEIAYNSTQKLGK